jgi:hypothetical protein
MDKDAAGQGPAFSEGLGAVAGSGALFPPGHAVVAWTSLALIVLSGAAFLLWLHVMGPQVRTDCEAKGGKLISTRATPLACVGAAARPAASK